MKQKIMIVLGTRPEAIKLAPVILELKRNSLFDVIVVGTAQHRDLLDQVLMLFKIQLDYDLNIMVAGQTLSTLTAAIVQTLDPIVLKEKPDLIVVQGDTTTTFLAGLIGFYHKIRVAHVEAGLRSHHTYEPFPEEINRRLVSHFCTFHFTPTQLATQNLLAEGIKPHTIHQVGNTVIDAFHYILKHSEWKERSFWEGHKFLLVTTHRRENFGRPLETICSALREIAKKHPSLKIVCVVHPNPQVKETLESSLKGIDNIILKPPLNYTEFVHLLKLSHIVLTDSGGVQEEAPLLGKPVLILRNVTERMEGVHAGVAKLVGTDKQKILEEVDRLLADPSHYTQMTRAQSKDLYGDGLAAQRIGEIINAL